MNIFFIVESMKLNCNIHMSVVTINCNCSNCKYYCNRNSTNNDEKNHRLNVDGDDNVVDDDDGDDYYTNANQ